ncbi:hypothetical protein IWW50_003068 [Coemansia erecta]|nr:hypothetical protein IWW50_003068 [Coemansia erecta]
MTNGGPFNFPDSAGQSSEAPAPPVPHVPPGPPMPPSDVTMRTASPVPAPLAPPSDVTMRTTTTQEESRQPEGPVYTLTQEEYNFMYGVMARMSAANPNWQAFPTNDSAQHSSVQPGSAQPNAAQDEQNRSKKIAIEAASLAFSKSSTVKPDLEALAKRATHFAEPTVELSLSQWIDDTKLSIDAFAATAKPRAVALTLVHLLEGEAKKVIGKRVPETPELLFERLKEHFPKYGFHNLVHDAVRNGTFFKGLRPVEVVGHARRVFEALDKTDHNAVTIAEALFGLSREAFVHFGRPEDVTVATFNQMCDHFQSIYEIREATVRVPQTLTGPGRNNNTYHRPAARPAATATPV